MIKLIFTNTVNSASVELKHIRTVEWSSSAIDDALVNIVTRVGARQREITINGFLNHGVFETARAAQEQLETDLRAVGVGTLSYTGASDFSDVRFLSLDFEEYRGNPVAGFTITFTTEEDNIHAHKTSKIGSTLLTPLNGFEEPEIKDVIRVQGDDEQLVGTKSRTFEFSGTIIGDDLDAVMLTQENLITEIKDQSTIVITLSSLSSVPGSYTVRPRNLEFTAPRLKDNKTARNYSFTCTTHDDYSKEPYTLGEVATSFAGISIDVVNGVDHNRDVEYASAGPVYNTLSETLEISGKKYFTSYTTYATFRDLFRPTPTNTYLISSTSGNSLEMFDITVGKFERDGNSAVDDAKRYSASVSMTFRWLPSIEESNFEYETTHFGVQWHKVVNVSFSVTLDNFGNITNRSVNVSGSVLDLATFNTLQSKVGTLVNYDGTYDNLYVSSVSMSGLETINVAGTQHQLYSVSVTASQLDTATQAFYFLSGVFDFAKAGGTGTTYSTETISFDKVTNRTKSFSNRYDGSTSKFIVTSINYSVSGEVFSTDASGEPTDKDKFVILFNKIDALLNSQQSTASVHTQNTTDLLPTNGDIHFMLTNINIGGWDPFTDEATGVRKWRQSISLSATAVFDLSGSSNTQPDFVQTRSESITEQAPKYKQIQVLNFGTVFKRIGTTPETLLVTYSIRWKNEELYRQDNASGLDFKLDDVGTGSWRGTGKNNKSKDQRENRSLTNRHIVEYTASEKMT